MEENESEAGFAPAIEPRFIPKNILAHDERVVFESHPSRWVCMKAATLALLIAVAAVLLFVWTLFPEAPDIPIVSSALSGVDMVLVQIVLIVISFIAIFFYYRRWIRWRKIVYAVTDERLIRRKGIVTEDYEFLPVIQIEDMEIHVSMWGKLLKYGWIEISSEPIDYGKKKQINWKAVPDPHSVARKIQEVMDTRKKPMRDKPTPASKDTKK